jgi:acetate kinase
LRVLSLNPGSSSVKAKLFIAEGDSFQEVRAWNESLAGSDFSAVLNRVLGQAGALGKIDAVGCRVVDGGPDLRETCLVSDDIVRKLEGAALLAPLHSQESLDAIKVLRAEHPNLPIVLGFDASFHRTLPAVAATYPLPRELTSRLKLARLGFHGLAYQSVVRALRTAGSLPKRLLAAHLGSGCSACAILEGASIDTTMGFTPLEGLMMGTRSGSIDPGMLLYLLENGHSVADLNRILNREGGLLGVSGLSADVRVLEREAQAGSAAATQALDLFCYLAAKHLAALAVPLGGVDGLCFSGGIGENSTSIRARICGHLQFLGFDLDQSPPATAGTVTLISKGKPSVWVVVADEELELARETARIVGQF